MLHIITGNGKGKTTSAIGMAVRACGCGMKVHFVQLLKGMPTGEIKPLKQLGIKVFRLEEITDFNYSAVSDLKGKNKALILSAVDNCDMLIIDEALSAIDLGFLEHDFTLELANSFDGELVLTGRNASAILKNAGDYVNEIKEIKHPYNYGKDARRGIEY